MDIAEDMISDFEEDIFEESEHEEKFKPPLTRIKWDRGMVSKENCYLSIVYCH